MGSSRLGNVAKSAETNDPEDETSADTQAPPSERTLIAMLRRALVSEGDLSAVMEFFFEHIGTNAALMKRARSVADADLEQTLRIVVGAVAGDRTQFRRALLLGVPEHAMVHGLVICQGLLGMMVFFEDLNQGVLALSEPGFEGPTLYCRFTRIFLAGRPKQKPN